MKDTPCTSARSFLQRTHGFIRPILGLGAGTAALLVALTASAGSFVADFNSGLPAGATIYGTATVDPTGGVTNSGCLKLTGAINTQQGSFVITNNLDEGTNIVALVARFQAYVGGGSGADGFSFNYAPDLPANGTFAEDGAGTGLTVSFDTYSNDFDVVGIELKGSGNPVAAWSTINLRAGTWVDVLIQMHPDGNVDVMYDGNWVFTNQWAGVPLPITGGRFGFGSRTGGANDNHWFDNLSITTIADTKAAAYVDYYYPTGRRVRADAPIYVELSDYFNYYTAINSQVNPSSIVLQVDGTTVSPTFTGAASKTAVRYQPPAIFASGSTHTVSLSFADNAMPTPNTTRQEWSFTVDSYKTLDTNLMAAPALVSANHGFALRVSQIDANRGPTIQRAENQLAGLLLDPTTGQPYLNRATLSATNEPCVINYSTAGAQGNFLTELPASIPGLPGALPDGTSAGDTNAALDAVTYLYLSPGIYTLGVNSSDGFRLTTASTPDLFAPQIAVYEGVRAAADSTVTFGIAQAGYYPFRICYFIGGQEVVYPTADVPSLEFFSVDSTGTKTLINDTNTTGSVAAFLPAQTLPYVRTIAPSAGETGVAKNAPIDVTLINGTITVQADSIQLLVNGTAVTPTVTMASGLVTVHYQRATTWPLNSTNTIQLAFTDSASNRRTNTWQFTTENVFTQLWAIAPASTVNATWAKWVTSGGTERGLAYNPRTGHVLLVSRNSATGTDGPNACGVGILDGNDGHYIGQLNLTLPDSTTIRANGLGTFKLDMIDVAEDGVIYAGNLTTSGTVPFIIYRWQNESASPTIAYTGNPADLTQATRCGDDFAVRGSGAGTQIIASGNSTVTNVPLFTTIDGTNFTGTCLKVTGLPAPTGGAVRLGLAWGCGNTFYGETTGANNPVRQITFAGPGSPVANLVASYTIVDSIGNQSIGPIGVDVLNQRLIGDATLGTGGSSHSMNLYDLNTLAVTPTVNNPIDSKPFAVSVGTFGTGAIDFTPDGSRVYTLDSGSGIIAFSLAPKLAVPAICAQPQTNLVASLGAIGFMDVMAIGAPQAYQWRFNGAALTGATNRALDIYNVQQSQLGLYSVVITNPLGSVTSTVAVLDTRMVVTSQPTSQRVNPGTPVTFTLGLSNGLAPYVYQWKLNGTDVATGTASSLTLNNAQVADAGTYTVSITDSLGQVITSQPAVLIVAPLGTGVGLTADYYNVPAFSTAAPANPFAGNPALSRVDPTVDFDWGTTGSPDLSYVTADYFTARWHGQVQPFYSQVHTFYTRTDDGVRLWVNGQLLVNQWVAQAPTEHSGTIALNAGNKYDLVMEYYEKASGAVAQLSWSTPSLPKAIISTTQLYTNSGPFRANLTSSLLNGTNVILNWMGTCTVESATNITGPWTPLATDIAGPYTNSIGSEPEMYFRLLSQQSL